MPTRAEKRKERRTCSVGRGSAFSNRQVKLRQFYSGFTLNVHSILSLRGKQLVYTGFTGVLC